jgi:hypothetical protein
MGGAKDARGKVTIATVYFWTRATTNFTTRLGREVLVLSASSIQILTRDDPSEFMLSRPHAATCSGMRLLCGHQSTGSNTLS